MATYNGWLIVSMPTAPSAKSIDFSLIELAAVAPNPFTGQEQIQDWQAGYMEAILTFPPMTATQAADFLTFLTSCKGPVNVFQLPAFLAAFVPAGQVPGAYWRLKNNLNKFSINEAILYGFSLEIREAI